jgi:excisionase family DNA binding protein
VKAARRANGCGSTARRMGSGEDRDKLQGHLMEANRRRGPASLSAGEEGQAPRKHTEVFGPEGRRQRLLPVGAAADYLGVSRATVERLVSRGQLPVVKVGGSTRYDVEDLDGFIATNRCRDRKRTA